MCKLKIYKDSVFLPIPYSYENSIIRILGLSLILAKFYFWLQVLIYRTFRFSSPHCASHAVKKNIYKQTLTYIRINNNLMVFH